MKNNTFFYRIIVRIYLLFVILLPSSLLLHAEDNRILFNRLDINHGLSSNEVTSIMKDKKGFMWFGTPAGLNRFDGYDFTTYKHEVDGALFSEEYIIHMTETQDENIWVTYHNERISVFNPRKNSFSKIENICDSLNLPLDIIHVFQEKEGNLLFATSDGRLCKYVYETTSIIDYPIDKVAGNVCDVVYKDNYLYVMHYSGVLEILDINKDQRVKKNNYLESRYQPRRYNLFVDSEGDVWVYFNPENHQGLFLFTPSSNRWQHFSTYTSQALSSSMIRDVREGEKGVIWVATDHGGINLIDKKTQRIRYLKNNPFDSRSISQNSVICLYKDDTGILWAGTYKNGVNYYHESIFKFSTYRYPVMEATDAGINDSNCVYEDKLGNLYIGTNGHGLLYYNRATGRYTKYIHDPADPHSISSNVIVSMTADRRGNLWLGTYTGGLDCFTGERFIHYQWDEEMEGGISGNSIYCLYVDEKDFLWMGTLGKGIDRLDLNTKEWRHYTVSGDNQSVNNVYTIVKGEGDLLYIGTTSGLYVLNTYTEEITPFTGGKEHDFYFRGKTIHSIYQDQQNLLWVGTNNGLSIYDPNTDSIYRLNRIKGLPDENVVSIIGDNNRHIWLGTKNGLVQLIPLHDIDYEMLFDIRVYSESEGVQGPQFNRNSVYRLSTGELLFGGTGGLTTFNPSKIKYNHNPPRVAITSFWLQNYLIEPDKPFQGKIILEEDISYINHLVLDYENRNFTLNIAALDYIMPRKSSLSFKMEGFDKEWTTIDAINRNITYMNMSPGNYVLQVKAKNNDGVPGLEPLNLKITIKPPFWLTGWAIAIYTGLFICFVILIIKIISRIEHKKLEKKQKQILINRMHEMDEMKLRFFTNVSHEFRTPLTLILNPLERLIKKGTNPEDVMLLKLVHQNASQLLSMVNQLLDFRKLDMQGHVLTLSVGDIIPFIRDIVYSFKELSGKKNIRFTFSSSFKTLPMKFDKDKVYKIIGNLLSNAFKFTPENGEIKVWVALYSSATKTDELVIKISDTGLGIKPEDREKIFERFYQSINPEKVNHGQGTGIGLHLCREFVKLHGGTISVESELGKGSVFTVSLPFVTTDLHEIISHIDSSTEECTSSLNKDKVTETITVSEDKPDNPTLVVIDDNNDFRKFMAISLQDDFVIYEAPDGEKGWEVIVKEMPDMIICDVMMPGIDGFELCKKIKNDLRTSHIPVILLTAKSGEESKITGLEAGADDYIGKPFNMDMLVLKIKRIMELRIQMQKKILQFSQNGIQLSEVNVNSLDQDLIRKAVTYIEDHLSDPQLSVEKISREMGMSRVNFYKKTMSITGKPPVELIRMIRIKKAGKILEKSQMRVSEVMLEVGINDLKLFRKYFKEEFGVLPSDYPEKRKDKEHL